MIIGTLPRIVLQYVESMSMNSCQLFKLKDLAGAGKYSCRPRNASRHIGKTPICDIITKDICVCRFHLDTS